MDLSNLPPCQGAPLKFMASAKGGWPIPIAFVDTNSNPVDLTAGTLTPVVLFYQPGRQPLPLVFTPTQGQVGIGVATVPEAVARATVPGNPVPLPGLITGLLAAIGPTPLCRAYAYLLDSLGNQTSGQVVQIQPIDWRTADPGDLPPVPTTYVTVGPAGAQGQQGTQGQQGIPGGAVPHTANAVASVTPFQVVQAVAGGVAPASSADPTQAGTVVGIVTVAATTGQTASYQDAGPIANTAWSWVPGPVFFDNAGQLTQSPPAGGFVQAVARALDAHTIAVDLGIAAVIVP